MIGYPILSGAAVLGAVRPRVSSLLSSDRTKPSGELDDKDHRELLEATVVGANAAAASELVAAVVCATLERAEDGLRSR